MARCRTSSPTSGTRTSRWKTHKRPLPAGCKADRGDARRQSLARIGPAGEAQPAEEAVCAGSLYRVAADGLDGRVRLSRYDVMELAHVVHELAHVRID